MIVLTLFVFCCTTIINSFVVRPCMPYVVQTLHAFFAVQTLHAFFAVQTLHVTSLSPYIPSFRW